jgi:hypothetical protein
MLQLLSTPGAQLSAVALANLFQSCLELAIVRQTAAHLGRLAGTQSHLMNFSARVPGSQNPDRVTAASGALIAAALMANRAMQQRAAQNFSELGQAIQNALDVCFIAPLHYL